jgi:predicted Zn-ribbon and HTH transcriptional regulator
MSKKLSSLEVRREVKQYSIDAVCPECKDGLMKPTGLSYHSWPVLYPHRCQECGYKEDFSVIYPRKVKEKK